ncbi:hypothetical protein RZS08_64690, partial [Arthrospira platensis SPKY1]|nr:hypothetical protein [Arthrospira platensis SPKY1]
MRHAIVLELAIAAIRVLLSDQPVSGPHARLQAILTTELCMTGHQPMHDLPLVENDRMTARLAEMA